MANVPMDNSSKKVEKTGTIYLNRTNNKNVMIGGDCGSNGTAKLVLTWPKNNTYPFYKLAMVFSEVMAKGLEAKSNSNKWRVEEITLKVTLEGNPHFKNATEKSFTSTFSGSSGPTYDVGGYYSCKSKDGSLKFETTTKNYAVHPVFEDVKLEPFVNKTANDAFGNNTYVCYRDHPTTLPTTSGSSNDIVPIAVGCALAGLVLIVLIAYIIGRRKSHRGYEKV